MGYCNQRQRCIGYSNQRSTVHWIWYSAVNGALDIVISGRRCIGYGKHRQRSFGDDHQRHRGIGYGKHRRPSFGYGNHRQRCLVIDENQRQRSIVVWAVFNVNGALRFGA